jgi:hypothetical protein
MILTNTNPNPAWTAAMGPQGIRFPPGSWGQGGGGYMGYVQMPLAGMVQMPIAGMVRAPNLPRWNSPPSVFGDDAGGAGVMIMDGGLPPGMTAAPPAGGTGAKILMGISVLAVGLYLFSR